MGLGTYSVSVRRPGKKKAGGADFSEDDLEEASVAFPTLLQAVDGLLWDLITWTQGCCGTFLRTVLGLAPALQLQYEKP